MTYVTGFLTPVKSEDKARYVKSAQASWPLFQKYGALSQVETWGEDVPDGKLTSFPMAVKLEPGEVVVFSWVTCPTAPPPTPAGRRWRPTPASPRWTCPSTASG